MTFVGLLNDVRNGGRLVRRVLDAPFHPRTGLGYFGLVSEIATVSETVGLPQQILFEAGQAEVSMWLLSLTAFSEHLPGAPLGSSVDLTLTAYNEAGQVIGSSALELLGNGLWQPLSVSAPGNSIRRVTLSVTNPGQPHYLFMDDLSFTAVPAPGSAAVFAAGLIAAGRSYRR